MAEFKPILRATIDREGGYRVSTVNGDRGGMTFAGISRRKWPGWLGWPVIDQNTAARSNGGSFKFLSPQMVEDFYRENFWTRIHGDDIPDPAVAAVIFDFAVTSGVRTAVRAAQRVVDAFVDGIMGPETMTGIASSETRSFLAAYAVERIRHYAGIVNRDRGQRKFLLGWVNRALEMSA